MNNVEPYTIKLIDNIEHQGIGGKEITIEKEGTISYILDCDLRKITIGLFNFITRRSDLFNADENMKIYYGHINNLGYFIAEDEIDKEVLKNE